MTTTLSRERAALLAAIEADPGERSIQLGFADWLAEHDEHERAELIRLFAKPC